MRKSLSTGLLPLLALFAIVSCNNDPIAPENTPGLELLGHTELKRSSVILSANPDASGISITECGFIVGKSFDLSNDAIKYRIPGYTGGKMTLEITGLDVGTTYYYRAYFTDGRRTKTTSVNSFTTLMQSTALIADFKLLGNILCATIVDNGGRPIKHVGFCWGTTENPDIFGNVKEVELSGTSFQMVLPDVDINKDYYFRAFADNCFDGNNAIAYSSNQLTYRNDEESQILLSSREFVVSQESEAIEIIVNSNIEFTVINPDVDWLHPIETKSLKSHALTYLVDKNNTYDNRYAEIKIVSESADKSEFVSIKQVQKDAIVVACDNYTVEANGGSIEFAVNHNVDYDIAIRMDWITQIQTKALIEDLLSFDIAPNTSFDNREGQIVFSSKDGSVSQCVTIYQAQNGSIVVSDKEKDINNAGGYFDIAIRSNVEYSVSFPDVDWIHPVETKAFTSRTLTYSVDVNETYDYRIGHIIVSAPSIGQHDTVTVTQMQKGAIVIAQNVYEHIAAAGIIEIDISRNVEFTVESTADWITQEIATKAMSSEKLRFHIAENQTDDPREGLIIFKASSSDITQTITIKQERGPAHINIPDANFKAYLVENFDKNADGEISAMEAAAVTKISVSTIYIRSLEGIEYFTNLLQLQCCPYFSSYKYNTNTGYFKFFDENQQEVYGSLSELNLKNNTKLTFLDCRGNPLKSLDVSYCRALKDIYCEACNISELNTDGCHNIELLCCMGNPLGNINVSRMANLVYLAADDCNLSSIDVRNNNQLLALCCCNNNICELDINNNPLLAVLYCDQNKLKTLNLSSNHSLEVLRCGLNDLASLVLYNTPYLKELYCYNTTIEALDLTQNPALQVLYCPNCNLSFCDISKCTSLEKFNVINNDNLKLIYVWQGFNKSTHPEFRKDKSADYCCWGDSVPIEDPVFKSIVVASYDVDGDGEISFSEAQKVTALHAYEDDSPYKVSEIKTLSGLQYFPNLTSLRMTAKSSAENELPILGCVDFMANPKMREVQLVSMNVESLNISSCSLLKTLSISCRNLQYVDVSHNPNLQKIAISWTPISTLDLSANTCLTYVACQYTELSTLTLPANNKITYLNVYCNKLIDLDISNQDQLEFLDCQQNNISKLDVSGKAKLKSLNCDENRIDSLNVSNSPFLEFLWCQRNNLVSLDLTNNHLLSSCAISDNDIHDIDISKNIHLTRLIMQGLPVAGINLSSNTHLEQLWCDGCKNLSSLDLSTCPEMSYLTCNNCSNLNELWLKTGQLISRYFSIPWYTEIKYK